MKIRQQKEIREFLVETFGKERGSALFDKQEKVLNILIGKIENKSENQKKTLVQIILPRIAVYQVLPETGLSREDLEACMRRYMMAIVAAKKHTFTAKMEWIPGFYFLYSRIFLKVVRTTDLWESVQKHDRDSFDVTMKQCLWHTACMENGCPELCRLFCDVDNATYGGLKKIGFSRTQTLGYGGDCCDFHFYKKQENNMNIYEVSERTEQLTDRLLHVWEASVRATHLFLSDAESRQIKTYVPQAIQSVGHLVIAERKPGEPVAFLGTEHGRLEMLFLSPKERGKGLGRQLLEYGIKQYGIQELTVNEQNPQAVGFYEHMGFQSYKRTELDEEGNPYPLLYMKKTEEKA